MRQVYDTPDGLEVVLQLSTSDIEVEVRDTTTTTVEIDGYDRETPPSVRCDRVSGGGHRLTIEHKVKRKWFAIGRGLDIRLVIPPATMIDGSSGAADLDANGTLGALSFKTGSGRSPVRRRHRRRPAHLRERGYRRAVGRRTPRVQGRIR